MLKYQIKVGSTSSEILQLDSAIHVLIALLNLKSVKSYQSTHVILHCTIVTGLVSRGSERCLQ